MPYSARQALFGFHDRTTGLWSASLWFDPMLLGHYSDEYFKTFGDKTPKIGPRDLEIISLVKTNGESLYTE